MLFDVALSSDIFATPQDTENDYLWIVKILYYTGIKLPTWNQSGFRMGLCSEDHWSI